MPQLNQRQQDVLYLLCRGLRNAEIGHQLGIREPTVKGYASQLFLIFDVTNRAELVGVAMEKATMAMNGAPPLKQPI
jgi:DNA-binding NarL/FixJ family response regulator